MKVRGGQQEGRPGLGGGRVWVTIAAVLCFLYGVAFTLNVHPIGDGLWFWYGRLYREHHLLYSGMHLPLQPLFVLLTAWTQSLFGVSWLASKLLALVQLGGFCLGLWLLAVRVSWTDGQRALLLGAAFVFTLTSSIFRFDDYHITNTCFVVFSLYLLLLVGDRVESRSGLWCSALPGVLAGLSLSNRLNDGATLFAASGFVLWFAARRFRWTAMALFAAGTAASFAGVILLTGDSFREWRLDTIVRASAIKGGTGSVLKGPLHFLKWQLRFNLLKPETIVQGLLVGLFVTCVAALWMDRRRSAYAAGWRRWAAGFLLAIVVIAAWRQRGMNWPNQAIGAYGMVFALWLATWMLWRAARRLRKGAGAEVEWRETLLMFPLLQIIACGMTSRSTNEGVFEVLGLFLLVLPLSAPWLFRREAGRVALAVAACVMICSGVIAKSMYPYAWHHFKDRAMFVDRVWYRHPIYGEMYIERDQLQLVKTICATINKDGTPTGLLEITNPYANWFCDVPPWHDYVQTWFDTVSRATMEELIAAVKSEPPPWIVYQRTLDTMEMHEVLYNGGKPLPHHELDQLIMQKVANGEWKIEYREWFQTGDWMVIRTAPAVRASMK